MRFDSSFITGENPDLDLLVDQIAQAMARDETMPNAGNLAEGWMSDRALDALKDEVLQVDQMVALAEVYRMVHATKCLTASASLLILLWQLSCELDLLSTNDAKFSQVRKLFRKASLLLEPLPDDTRKQRCADFLSDLRRIFDECVIGHYLQVTADGLQRAELDLFAADVPSAAISTMRAAAARVKCTLVRPEKAKVITACMRAFEESVCTTVKYNGKGNPTAQRCAFLDTAVIYMQLVVAVGTGSPAFAEELLQRMAEWAANNPDEAAANAAPMLLAKAILYMIRPNKGTALDFRSFNSAMEAGTFETMDGASAETLYTAHLFLAQDAVFMCQADEAKRWLNAIIDADAAPPYITAVARRRLAPLSQEP